MAKSTSSPPTAEPAAEANGSEAATSPPSKPVSQRDAVRIALEALGNDASNASLVQYVREHYGHDVSKYISQYKNAARKVIKTKIPRTRKKRATMLGSHHRPRKTPPALPKPATPKVPPLARDVGLLADLTTRYGADQVRELLEILERYEKSKG